LTTDWREEKESVLLTTREVREYYMNAVVQALAGGELERLFTCKTPNCGWSCFVLADETAESVLEEKVGGEYATFRVYVFLLRAGTASVRDVYRGCDLSSPSLALHHLEKLEGLNLVRKDENGVYHVIARRFGVLRFFHKTGREGGCCPAASYTR
jgi:hypothetical protein